MQRVGQIAVDVDHQLGDLVADAGAIGLANCARANDDQQFRLGHRIVAAD